MSTDAATLDSTQTFLTPARILIPKLVRSRDGWKKRAGQRKSQAKTLAIRVRDLDASRTNWKERARRAEAEAEAEAELEQVQTQLRDSQTAVESLRQEVAEGPKKVSTSH